MKGTLQLLEIRSMDQFVASAGLAEDNSVSMIAKLKSAILGIYLVKTREKSLILDNIECLH